jgi:hypothetical protein
MDAIWQEMGYIRWPLLFSFLAVVGLSTWSALRLYRPGASADLRTKAWVDAVLFWGGFALFAGVLGTLVGVIIAAQFIERASDVNPGLVWGGIRVALLSFVAGLLILGFAGVVWFTLQMRWRFLRAGEGDVGSMTGGG